MMTVTPSQHDDDVGQHKMMTTNTTSDEMFKQKSKVPQNGSQDPVKLVCAPPKSSGQALVHYFCQNSTLSNLKKFNKTPVSILSRYRIQTLKRFASNPIAMQYLLQL